MGLLWVAGFIVLLYNKHILDTGENMTPIIAYTCDNVTTLTLNTYYR